jgi:hypothetical protein
MTYTSNERGRGQPDPTGLIHCWLIDEEVHLRSRVEPTLEPPSVLPAPVNDAPNSDQRPAGSKCRSLAAWFPNEGGKPPAQGPGSREWAKLAGAEVAKRPVSPDQEGLIQLLPESLHDHVKQLQQFPDARRMFDDKWGVALVTDLRRLVSAQPSVRIGDPVDDVTPESDPRSIAHVTLPVQRPRAELPAEFDPALQAWKITSKSPNIRITNKYGSEVREGFFTFGFVVEVLTSFLSVAQYRGRLVLRDGYHRAYRLISSGVFAAPAFVRIYADDESVFTKKTPSERIWTGDRPPLLGDFTNDVVARDIWLPSHDTTLYIGATPPGLSVDPRANR